MTVPSFLVEIWIKLRWRDLAVFRECFAGRAWRQENTKNVVDLETKVETPRNCEGEKW